MPFKDFFLSLIPQVFIHIFPPSTFWVFFWLEIFKSKTFKRRQLKTMERIFQNFFFIWSVKVWLVLFCFVFNRKVFKGTRIPAEKTGKNGSNNDLQVKRVRGYSKWGNRGCILMLNVVISSSSSSKTPASDTHQGTATSARLSTF